MFSNLVSSLNRWVGQHRHDSSLRMDEGERRVWLRLPCDLQTVCQPAEGGEAVRFAARVQDISRGGISLLASRPFEKGALLCVELPGAELDSTCHVLAYVIRVVARASGEWILGCTFATELRDEELRPYEAKRIRPMPPDPRRWVRFPCAADVSYRRSDAAPEEAQTAQAVDISPRGIGFHLNQALEVGSMLSLELNGTRGEPALKILASVVRAATAGGPSWFIGCNFIRELTEKELNSLR
jgi:hypothetical protein